MKKLIYKIEAYSLVGNPETGEDERQPSPSVVFVNNPSEEDIARAAEIAYNGEYIIEDDGLVEEPTQLDRIESQVVYLAMMTGNENILEV